jgi:hypothetical protein
MGGGEYNRGTEADVAPSKDFAHTGSWSAKLTMTAKDPSDTSGANGAKIYRWNEQKQNRELYYSIWYYFPQRYALIPYGWTNWTQWRSQIIGGANDPFFILDMLNRKDTGAMYFVLTWWPGLTIEGPFPGQTGGRTWPSAINIPVGQWFHIEARYVCAGDFTGAVQVWQDGVEIFNLNGVKTRYSNGDCQWSVDNYGKGITPSNVVIYVDDAAISTTRIGH